MATTMSVAERIAILQQIFNNFGIPVIPNSSLDLAIRAEFGRGKRSKLNDLLATLNTQSDAAGLATCIGAELKTIGNNKYIATVADFMLQRLPALLQIIDIRQQTQKREALLHQLLTHFETKIPDTPQSARLLRMLAAAKQNLHREQQLQNVGVVIEQAGVMVNLEQIQRCGKILQGITPALLALERNETPIEQKINHCVHALQVLGVELRNSNLQKAATIIEHVHGLAKVSLPQLTDQINTEQALQKLGICIGRISMQQLQARAVQDGLTAQEATQLLYAGATPEAFNIQDKELLKNTQQNQQYAAICGYIAQLAGEVRLPQLEKIAVAGVCLAAMRQTYVELKTKNLNVVNFSESLGIILNGVGAVTNNNTLSQLGNAVLAGVTTYAGLMAVPGGAAVAVPLAVCSVVGKIVLESSSKKAATEQEQPQIDTNKVFCKILSQLVQEQQQMRHEFASLYRSMQQLQQETIAVMDQGFINLAQLTQDNKQQVLQAIKANDSKLDILQYSLTKEFSDLYLEYVRNPLEEIDFASKYGWHDQQGLQRNKHKLSMWLLYKAKHKVNGLSLIAEQEASPDFPKYMRGLLTKTNDVDAVLAMLNRYANLKLVQQLPEDLPHIPTWLQAARAYVILSCNQVQIESVNEAQMLKDIIAVGSRITSFVSTLAQDKEFWSTFAGALQVEYNKLQATWNAILGANYGRYLLDATQLCDHGATMPTSYVAHSAAVQQLEPFTPIMVDVTQLWQRHLQQYIPAEFVSAHNYGLGELQINFTVDQTVNTFADLHIDSSNHILPDQARDVLFKVDVHFKYSNCNEPLLLSTSWFAYDLQNSQRRFDDYYMRKFLYPLKHRRYRWISLDGKVNQVEGHGDTLSTKLINYDSLATIYRDWLLQAEPINDPAILQRLYWNPKFRRQCGNLLQQAQATTTNDVNIALLQPQLQLELRKHFLKQRANTANALQQNQQLQAVMEAIATYYAVLAVYARLLNLPFVAPKINEQFAELINNLRQEEYLEQDLLQQFNLLFTLQPWLFEPKDEYLQGEFYLKVQTALAQLGMLQSNIIISKLQLAA